MFVSMHQSQKKWGGYWDAICKIAVPCFFMITGYFYDSSLDKNFPLKQIRKIFFLDLWSNLLYFSWNLFWALRGETVAQYLLTFSSLSSIWNRKVAMGALLSGHLWYITALLLVLIIVFVFDKFRIRRYLYWGIPFFYLCGVFLGKYSFLFSERSLPIVYSRNFLLTGLCFFLIGNLIYKIKEHYIYRTIYKRRYCILIVLLAMLLLEKFTLQMISHDGKGDMYLLNGLLAVAVFVAFNGLDVSGKFFSTLSIWGRKHSTYIYILHYMILDFVNRAATKLWGSDLSIGIEIVLPFIVFLCSLFCSVIITKVIKLRR